MSGKRGLLQHLNRLEVSDEAIFRIAETLAKAIRNKFMTTSHFNHNLLKLLWRYRRRHERIFANARRTRSLHVL